MYNGCCYRHRVVLEYENCDDHDVTLNMGYLKMLFFLVMDKEVKLVSMMWSCYIVLEWVYGCTKITSIFP